MTPIDGRKPEEQDVPGQRKSAKESKVSVRSSVFKYYIHDSVEACRLQLIGDLSEAEIPELSGCWATARTTLASRNLVLDVRKLRNIDDSGKQWIIFLANEGALLLPDTFLRNGFASRPDEASDPLSSGLFTRLAAFFRGSRSVSEPSSTQAQ